MNYRYIKCAFMSLALLMTLGCEEDSITNPNSTFVQLDDAGAVSILENSGQMVEVLIALGGPQSTDTQVELNATGDASRYNLSSTIITIPAGDTSATVNFTAIDDEEINGNVDIVISLAASSSVPVGIGGEGVAAVSKTITIIDDNVPCNDYVITITLDAYGNETYWTIVDDAGSIVVEGGPYPDNQFGTDNTVNVTLEDGCYSFRMWDEYGDGQVSNAGTGGYLVNCGSIIQASGSGDLGMIGIPGATAADLPTGFAFQQTPTTDLVGFVENTDFCVNQ